MIYLLPDYALKNYITSYSAEERRQAHALWKSSTARPALIDFKSYSYDRNNLEYYDKRRNRKIPTAQVNIDVLRFAQSMRDKQRQLTQRAINKQITEQQWYEESLRYMKLSYRAAIDVASGDQKDDNDELLLLLLLLFFNRFQNMAKQIDSGQLVLAGAALGGGVVIPATKSLLGRVSLYGMNVHSVYHNYKLQDAKRSGYTECRRLPGPTEHCENDIRPGCNKLIAKGWMPVSEMIPIGQTTCLSNCQCTLQFRNRILGIYSPVINSSKSFLHVYDDAGKLLFKYSPDNQHIEIKHKWHDHPVTVDLKKYRL